jgi:hypothetical protein
VVPAHEFRRISGSMSQENTEVVHPGGGEEHIVVADGEVRDGDLAAEGVEARLMAKLIGWRRLGLNIVDDGFPPICANGSHETTFSASGA